MRDMEAVGEEFFGLPAMDKAEFYSESEVMNKVVSTRLYSTPAPPTRPAARSTGGTVSVLSAAYPSTTTAQRTGLTSPRGSGNNSIS
jgi:hypothetical protein